MAAGEMGGLSLEGVLSLRALMGRGLPTLGDANSKLSVGIGSPEASTSHGVCTQAELLLACFLPWAGLGPLWPQHRSGEQAQTLSRRDRLDPSVRAQFLGCVSQMVSDRIGRERELSRNLRRG
jgi:hypothetical protein